MSSPEFNITDDSKPITAYVVIVTEEDVKVTDTFIMKDRVLELSEIVPMQKKVEPLDVQIATMALATKFAAAIKRAQKEVADEQQNLSSDGA